MLQHKKVFSQILYLVTPLIFMRMNARSKSIRLEAPMKEISIAITIIEPVDTRFLAKHIVLHSKDVINLNLNVHFKHHSFLGDSHIRDVGLQGAESVIGILQTAMNITKRLNMSL